LSLFLVSCSVWPPSLLEAAFFFCYSSTALAGGYSCVTLTLTLRYILRSPEFNKASESRVGVYTVRIVFEGR